MLGVAAEVMGHTESLHDPLRPKVRRCRKGHDLVQPELLDAEGERRATALGRIALTPSIDSQAPADLDGRGERGVESHPAESQKADELLAGRHLDRPPAQPRSAKLAWTRSMIASLSGKLIWGLRGYILPK
jgi:hypothetical protein